MVVSLAGLTAAGEQRTEGYVSRRICLEVNDSKDSAFGEHPGEQIARRVICFPEFW